MPIGQGIGAPPLIREGDPRATFILNSYLQELNRIARNLTFLDVNGEVVDDSRPLNLDAIWIQYTSNVVANTEDTVAHSLGRIPVGIFVGLPDKSATIYSGPTAWTSDNIYLRASASTVTVFVLAF